MCSTVQCTWPEMKQMGSEFLRALPSLDRDQADNAMKCLGLALLGLEGAEIERQQAVHLFRYASHAYLRHEAALDIRSARCA